MLHLIVLVVFGLVKKQKARFWKYAFVASILNQFSLSAFNVQHGSIGTQFDNPYVAVSLGVVIGWIVPIILVVKGYAGPDKELE